jgi:formate hydrogenlyase subunit 6/NADH:ubiquinone oxidoreductase subunit I
VTAPALRYEDCVRTRSRAAACRACVDACPVDAVTLDPRGAVRVDLSRCVSCAVCQSACPTEALDAGFDVAAFLADAPAELACGDDGLPCVAALAVEDLLALARLHPALTLRPRPGCAAEGAHGAVTSRVDEAVRVLRAMGEARTLRVEDGPPRTGPLEALRRMLRATHDGEITLDPRALDRDRLRATRVPARRARWLAAWGAAVTGELSSESVSFASEKRWNTQTCTACTVCANVCPTGALSPAALWRELRFDAARCVRCGLCHDVCEPRALTLAPEVSLAALTLGRPKPLGRMVMRACGECGSVFKPLGDEGLCARCQDMDDEARELHGVGR